MRITAAVPVHSVAFRGAFCVDLSRSACIRVRATLSLPRRCRGKIGRAPHALPVRAEGLAPVARPPSTNRCSDAKPRGFIRGARYGIRSWIARLIRLMSSALGLVSVNAFDLPSRPCSSLVVVLPGILMTSITVNSFPSYCRACLTCAVSRPARIESTSFAISTC